MGDIADEHVDAMIAGDFDGTWDAHECYMEEYISNTFLTPEGLMTRHEALRAGYWIDGAGICTKVSELEDGHIVAIIKYKKQKRRRIPVIIQREFDKRNVNSWMELIS